MTMRARARSLLLTLLCTLGMARVASAHPMGNFSVNHYSKIDLLTDRVSIQYFIDLAEIPAYQEMQQGELRADPKDPAVIQYVAGRGQELSRGLSLTVNDQRLALRLISSGLIFPPGAGGLPTMKMGFVYEAGYPSGVDVSQVKLHYADNNFPGHTGWKEIIAVASAGTLLSSTVPGSDRSNELNNYPTDLLNGPPQNLEASLVARLQPVAVTSSTVAAKTAGHVLSTAFTAAHNAGATVAAPTGRPAAIVKRSDVPQKGVSTLPAEAMGLKKAAQAVTLRPNQQQTPRNRFTELIAAPHLSLWFLFTAAIIAMGLGALHALEPGHGKTIVAAYLVGSRGTAAHALLLGLIVTASHTAGVFALGAITLYASRYIVPEQLYPWLGLFSGFMIAGLGCYMALRRLAGTAVEHSHTPGQPNHHWSFFQRGNENRESEDVRSSAPAGSVSLGQLFTLGITGGIIPCPAALIVLLSAFALHRIGLGFLLIVAFSIGLAAVLIGFGMLMVFARQFMSRMAIDGPLTRRWLPVASSMFVTVLGIGLILQAVQQMNLHLASISISKEQIGPLLFVTGLGLILGMRHSTDADHVVAISTIVTKQKSIRGAAMIGTVWGIGHTITIFVVGSMIILFRVEIPTRVGLSMEFCVALMLVLLGILNLSGVMQKITLYFTPASARLNLVQADIQSTTRRSNRFSSFTNSVGQLGVYHYARPLVIGLVHGLAGSAAVALLVLSTIHDPIWATVYLLIFGGGTTLGMMCMTAMIAAPLTFAGARSRKLGSYLGTASGMVSLCFGAFLVYQLGFVGGLFTSHPQWTPR